MQKISKTVLLTFLMVILGLSAATNSLNEATETTALGEVSAPQEVILPIASLNEPGHQEGSIFTDTTLSSGNSHTCAILDDGSVSCWGEGGSGQLGNGGTSDKTTPTPTSSLGTGRTAVAISSGVLTPVQFSMTVLFHVGGKEVMANWAMVEHQIKLHLHPRAALEQAALLSPSLLERCSTPVQFSMTVLSHVGEKERVADWATVKDMITNPTSTNSLGTGRTAVAISSGGAHTCAILDDGSVSCWGEGGMADWALEHQIQMNFRLLPRALLEQAALL